MGLRQEFRISNANEPNLFEFIESFADSFIASKRNGLHLITSTSKNMFEFEVLIEGKSLLTNRSENTTSS